MQFARVTAESKVEHQIIFATVMIAPDLDDEHYTAGEFSTGDDPTIKVRPYGHTKTGGGRLRRAPGAHASTWSAAPHLQMNILPYGLDYADGDSPRYPPAAAKL
jgi:hypothetical protein